MPVFVLLFFHAQEKDGTELRPVFRCLRAFVMIQDTLTKARAEQTIEPVANYAELNRSV